MRQFKQKNTGNMIYKEKWQLEEQTAKIVSIESIEAC